MNRFSRFPLCALASCTLTACTPAPPAPRAPVPIAGLERVLHGILAPLPDTLEVSIALLDLATGDSLLVAAHTPMHAASTMKVPVMLELFRRADAGEISLDAPIALRNDFRSIADGSAYALSADDDSDRELYSRLGGSATVRELIERMIARSSNLATNLLIDLAGPERIARTLAELGAAETKVLRGVEDIPAYTAGMNNQTTAYGMMKVLQGIASGRAASSAATEEMLAILERQEFREMIPAGLPEGVRVANKTGWITGINHDAAIVLPAERSPYVLVVLTRGYHDREAASQVAREISAAAYAALVRGD